jgi:diguanylate cyclase (GGDEF)-like protein
LTGLATHWRWLCLLLILLGSFSSARAAIVLDDQQAAWTLGPHLRYLLDETKSLTPETLQQQPPAWHTSEQSNLTLGYQKAPLWITWDLQRTPTAPARWYAVFHYPLLDQIELYLYSEAQQRIVQTWKSGDHHAFADRQFRHPKFIAPLDLNVGDTYRVWVKISTEGALQIPLTLESVEHFWEVDRYRSMFEAGIYFICLAMALYNGVLFFALRDKSFLFYSLYIFFFIIGVGGLHGWASEFVGQQNPRLQDWCIIQGGLIAVACAGAFATHFMRLAQIAPRAHRFLIWQALFTLLLALALLYTPYQVASKSAAGITLISSVLMVFIAIAVWYQTRSRQAAFYCVSWLFLLVGAGLNMGSKFGLVPTTVLSEEGLRFGALFEIMVLSFALADRVNQDRKATEAAQRKVIDIQATMNAELEKQVKTRTCELEALNQILHQNSITDPLTGVFNRRHYDDVLDKEFRRAARDDQPIAVLMVDLDHFKKINDTHGHPMGDYCLKQAAETINNTVKRPPDIVARYGGEEFVVLLPNTPPTGAREVAQQILEALRALEIATHDGHRIPLTASIGIGACQAHPGQAAAELMLAADQALYRAKHGGRNRVAS